MHDDVSLKDHIDAMHDIGLSMCVDDALMMQMVWATIGSP